MSPLAGQSIDVFFELDLNQRQLFRVFLVVGDLGIAAPLVFHHLLEDATKFLLVRPEEKEEAGHSGNSSDGEDGEEDAVCPADVPLAIQFEHPP